MSGVNFLYGITFPTEFIRHTDDTFAYADDSLVDPEPHDNLRIYSKFYEPLYGDTVGPRVLLFFEVDIDLVAIVLCHDLNVQTAISTLP